MRAAVVPLVVFLAGCASVDVRGPYASRLSPVDVREIRSSVIPEPRLISPWIHITAIAPDRVQVEYGGLTSSDGMTVDGSESFKSFMLKRNGKWIFDMRFGVELSSHMTVY
jgi:hypothetical protein